MNKKKIVLVDRCQYNSIDLVKFIMAFAVIAIHTRPLINCENQKIFTIYDNVVCMAVPFFFLATGYLLSKKLSFPYSESDIPIIRKYFMKIIKMYLMWMAIYTPISIYHNVAIRISFFRALLLYIRGLFFMGEQYNSWPLWYLLSTIYALIVIMILIKLKITPRGMLIISFFFSIISIGIDWFVAVESDMPTVLLDIQKLISCAISTGRIFRSMIYIPVGMYLAHKQLPQVGNVVLLIGGFILNYFIANNVISSYLLVITVIGFFGITEDITLKNNAIYALLRNMSTILYLIHMYVWSFYYKLVYGTKTYGLDSFIVTAIVSCIIAFSYLKIKKYKG